MDVGRRRWEICHVYIEQDRRKYAPLWDPRFGVLLPGFGAVQEGELGSAFDIVGYEFYDCWRGLGLLDLLNKVMQMNSVECLRHIQSYCYGSLGRLPLVESGCDYVIDLVKCCGG